MTCVRNVKSVGRLRWMPAAVHSFCFDAGINNRSGALLTISPKPSTHTEIPKSAPVRRGSASLVAIAAPQVAGGAVVTRSGCVDPQTEVHGGKGANEEPAEVD